MNFSLVTLMVVLAGAQAVTAAASWAKFCSNEAHTTDCTNDFQITNTGCFSISSQSAQWVWFHSDVAFLDIWQEKSLIVSPNGGCPCQSAKQTFSQDQISGGKAIKLNDGVAGKPSYRFIGGSGSGNNC